MIPETVYAQAKAFVDANNPDNHTVYPWQIEVVARAIMAERERCETIVHYCHQKRFHYHEIRRLVNEGVTP
ncbi:hypothetical protein EV128_12260 [Rhizobium azibense]|nr:hypothetical protein EV128_12260 [Rhizobium azibense]